MNDCATARPKAFAKLSQYRHERLALALFFREHRLGAREAVHRFWLARTELAQVYLSSEVFGMTCQRTLDKLLRKSAKHALWLGFAAIIRRTGKTSCMPAIRIRR